MLHFKKTLFISALAVSLAACSTNSEPQASPTSTDSPSISSASLPSPQNTGSVDSAATSNEKEKRFSQEIKLSETLKTTKVGEIIKIPVTVKNTSNFIWEKDSSSPVNFSYHWLDSKGKIVVHEGERTLLPENLAPQESAELNTVIKAPDHPGKYSLNLTMVQEYVGWFENKGAKSLKIPVTVTSQ